jgi:hypothetical protein
MKKDRLPFSEKPMVELLAFPIKDLISERREQILSALNYSDEGQSVDELEIEMVNDCFRCVLIAAQPTPQIIRNSLIRIAEDPTLAEIAPDSVTYALAHTIVSNSFFAREHFCGQLSNEQLSESQYYFQMRTAGRAAAAKIHLRRGRLTKAHQDFITERLVAYFLRYNGLIKRKSVLTSGEFGLQQKEEGAFRLFLDAALPPLDFCFSGYEELALSRETIARKAFDFQS